jgi:acetyl esterase/lipase
MRALARTLFTSLLLVCVQANWAADTNKMIRVGTHIYKQVGSLKINTDVYSFDDEKVRPAVVWIHGGALIMGNRRGIDSRIKAWASESGYVLVSIDYRLAPETKLPAIVEDVEDAFKWLHSEGRARFRIDPSCLAVCGGSAGGYLTLVAGYRVKPRPKALVSFYGYGDLIGDWYSQPSYHKRHNTVTMAEEQARRLVSGPAISDARDRAGDGSGFYQFCRQRGLWPKEVSGWDPKTDAEKFDPFMPIKHVSSDFPPTLLIHGTADTDVPFDQSVLMQEQFKRHGVVQELISIPNAEHGLSGGDPTLVDKAYQSAFSFLDRYLRQ